MVDATSGLRLCSVVSGAAQCECRSGWDGARCHVADGEGLVDASGYVCPGTTSSRMPARLRQLQRVKLYRPICWMADRTAAHTSICQLAVCNSELK